MVPLARSVSPAGSFRQSFRVTAALRRVVRACLGPAGLSVILLLLLVDAAFITQFVRHRSWGGRLIRQTLWRERVRSGPWPVVTLWVVQDPDGSRHMISPDDSADELSRLSQLAPERLVQASYIQEHWDDGPWAPWFRRKVDLIALTAMHTGDTPSPDTAAAAREFLATTLDDMGRPREAALARQGGQNQHAFLWWGVAHDFLVGGLSLLALAGVVRLPGELARRRRDRAVKHRLCPGCGYDLSAHAAHAACPECGRPSGPAI